MNYKNNLKYFTQKNVYLYVGIAVMLAGIVFICVNSWMWLAGAGIAAAGLAVIAIGREGLVKGDELDAELSKASDATREETIKNYSLNPDTADVLVFSEYNFDGQTVQTMRKGTDGKFRPKQATSTAMLEMGESLVFYVKRFSLTEETEEVLKYAYKLSEILPIESEEKSVEEGDGVLVRYHALAVKASDGSLALELPVPQNAELYEKLEEINRDIKSAHRNA